MPTIATLATSTLSTVSKPYVHVGPDYAFVDEVANRLTHNDITRKVSNMLEAKGAAIHNEPELIRDNMDHRKNWNADIVADFAHVKVIVEVKPEKVSDFAHAIKQVLYYASVINSAKPVVCIVTNGVDFYAFNPRNFSLVALMKNLSACPSQHDASAIKSLKRQVAFKSLVSNKVASMARMSKETLATFLSGVAGVA